MENQNKSLIKATTQAIRHYNLSQPGDVVRMAKTLQAYIVKQELYVEISGKKYTLVEGWQFAGGLLGLYPRVVRVESKGENKWLAEVEIVDRKTDKVVSTGFAVCSKEEARKKTFDEYAILSMAQTRAIGKAYRNLIGWVMKLAGYEATPAEEMKPVASASGGSPMSPKIASADLLSKSIEKIAATNTKEALIICRDKIVKSECYGDGQKKMLLNAIAGKIERLANDKKK